VFEEQFGPAQPNALLYKAILPFFQPGKVTSMIQLKFDLTLASGVGIFFCGDLHLS
jgi:hypothetical protein